MTDEQRAKRLHYHMYESLEGIQEQSQRIVALEELVQKAHHWGTTSICSDCPTADECHTSSKCIFWAWFAYRMKELGIMEDEDE